MKANLKVTGEAKLKLGRNKTIRLVPGRLNYHWVNWIKPLGRVSLGLLQRGVIKVYDAARKYAWSRMIRFDTRESVILWPSSITLVVSWEGNERNAESKEITGITYQSATIKISSVENILCFLFFRYRKRIKWMYFSTQTTIMTELTELTELVEVFHNIYLLWKSYFKDRGI